MTKQIPTSKSQLQKLVPAFFLFSVFFFLQLPTIAEAALIPPECMPSRAINDCKFEHLGQLLVNIYNYMLGLAGLVAIMFVIWGGFQMVYGWTTEQPESAYKEGQLTVRRALWGLILVAAAYLVVNTLLTVVFGADSLNTYFSDIFK